MSGSEKMRREREDEVEISFIQRAERSENMVRRKVFY